MHFNRGDHICVIYSTTDELVREAADFLAQGVWRHERCWYVASANEAPRVGAALRELGLDVDALQARGALQLISGSGAYVVHGDFNPEATIAIFNDAIEQAYADGFTGFRAAADMSWALEHEDGPHQLIVYEALLKSLFSSCRATGMCFYNRRHMPLAVVNGALATHPVAGSHGHYEANRFYDPAATRLGQADDAEVRERLAQLDRLGSSSSR